MSMTTPPRGNRRPTRTRSGYVTPDPMEENLVLMAHPAVLRNLVEQYLALRVLHAEQSGEEARRRMNDVAYTLCVSTGTRDVDTALIVARHHLPGSGAEDDSVLTT